MSIIVLDCLTLWLMYLFLPSPFISLLSTTSFGNTNQCCCGNDQWQTYFVVRVQPRTYPHPLCSLGIGGAITDCSEGLLGLLGFVIEQHSSEHWLPSLFLGCAPHRRRGSDFDDWATEQKESQGDSGSCLETEIQFWILCVPLVSSVLLGKRDCLLGMWLMLGIIIFSFKSPATTSTSNHPPPLAYLLSCYKILLCTRFCFLCALGEQALESITRKKKGLVKANEEGSVLLAKDWSRQGHVISLWPVQYKRKSAEGILQSQKIHGQRKQFFSAADIFVSACDAWNCDSHLGIIKGINLRRPY